MIKEEVSREETSETSKSSNIITIIETFAKKQIRIDSKAHLPILKDFFQKTPYPEKMDLEHLSSILPYSLEKIRNWFRAERVKTRVSERTKKVFSKDENEFLLKLYSLEPYPSKELYEKIAKVMSCNIKNVQHWFVYRRKIRIKSGKTDKMQRQKEKLEKNFPDEKNKIIPSNCLKRSSSQDLITMKEQFFEKKE